MTCPGCLKKNQNGYCRKCRKELFNGKNVDAILPFNSPYSEENQIFLDHTKRISISGVQIKYSLQLVDDQLQLTDTGGQYIIKPIPTGTFSNLDQAPANEHLTMQMAKQVYKIDTPPNALIFFSDQSPAYITRRFDRVKGKKLQQEDFAQIARMTTETHGANYKYDLSYEEIVEYIQNYIPTYRIEIEKFFHQILFNYVVSNGDAHLKNFSAIQTRDGDYVLTPAYDLLCTKLHAPNEADLALMLFKEGFSKAYESYGFYTYQDFWEFGQKIGIKRSRVEKIIYNYLVPQPLVRDLIQQSFLSAKSKELYKSYYADRIHRLNMGRS